MRIEHVTPSRCREEFLARQAKNDAIKHAAKERGGAQPNSSAAFQLMRAPVLSSRTLGALLNAPVTRACPSLSIV